MRTTILTVLRAAALVLIQLLSLPARAQEDALEEDRQALLALHQAGIHHHVEGDAEALVSDLSETFLAVSDGKIHRQARADVRAFFERYMKDAEYDDYSDHEPPIVRVSSDGTMAWIISRMHVKRRQPAAGGEGNAVVREFVYAGIMTYEKVDEGGQRLGLRAPRF